METKTSPKSSRTTIVETALELFARNGYDRTPISMIAREANVAQGLMYRYFTGKEALLKEIVEQSMTEVQSSLKVSTSGLPHEKLEEYLNNVVRMIRSNRDFWTLFYGLRSQPFVQELLGKEFADFQANAVSLLESFFDPRDPDAQRVEALLLYSIVDGICTSYALAPNADLYPIEDVKECVIDKYR
ncbi:MAG: TetR/AcrR family transcriptional regulator [Ignavibacteriae bacterium]|nr:TetR/AcrR family transcriptional regulator [Ignavibacteriota bacterium]